MTVYVAPNVPENPKFGDVVIRINDDVGMKNRFLLVGFYREDNEGLYLVDYIIDFLTDKVERRAHYLSRVVDSDGEVTEEFWSSTKPLYVSLSEILLLLDSYFATVKIVENEKSFV